MQELHCSELTDQNISCFFSIQNYIGHSAPFEFILPVIFIFKNETNFTGVWAHKVRYENHIFNPWWNKSLMNSFISRLQSHYEETVYFLPLTSQEF